MSKKGETGERDRGNLSLRRRRIEMLNAKIKSPPDLKDKNPDRMIAA